MKPVAQSEGCGAGPRPPRPFDGRGEKGGGGGITHAALF